jgi:hypothetical protein
VGGADGAGGVAGAQGGDRAQLASCAVLRQHEEAGAHVRAGRGEQGHGGLAAGQAQRLGVHDGIAGGQGVGQGSPVLAEEHLGPVVAHRAHEDRRTVGRPQLEDHTRDGLEEDVGEAGLAEAVGDVDLHGRYA